MADRQRDQMGVCALVPAKHDPKRLRVFGMAILVADRVVVTCAHVVNLALGRDPAAQEDAKGCKLQVWFPFDGPESCVGGKVERWFPLGEHTRGEPSDVSVILLDEDAPQSVRRAVLKPYCVTGPGNPAPTTFGYQYRTVDDGSGRSHPTGERPAGRIIGSIPGGLGQFDGFPVTGAAIQQGFSGSGIYDPGQDSIVGMVQKGDKDTTKKIALFFATPTLEKALEGIPRPPPVRQRDEVRQSPVLFQWRDLAGEDGSDGGIPVSGRIQGVAGRTGLKVGRLRALAALMFSSPSLAADKARVDLVNHLTAELGEGLLTPTNGSEADLIDILAIAFRSSEGIDALLRILPDYISNAALLRSVEHGAERLQWVATIWDLLRDVPVGNSDLQKLYKLSSPDPQRAPEANDLDDVVEALWRMAPKRPGGIHPLFEFVERTARQFHQPKLSQWVEDYVPNIGLVADLRHALKQEEKAAASRRVNYLLIDVLGPTPERVPYWLLDEGFSCKVHDEVACDRSLASLRDAVGKILDKVEKFALPELVVEFFVPWELMHCDLDQWELPYEARIGELYPVVLRWRDRAERARNTRAGVWERVAERLREHLRGNRNALCTFWVNAKDGPGVRLMSAVGAGDYGHCIGFLFVPIGKQLPQRDDLLRCALGGGMPFGFWLRREPPDWKAFQTGLDELLSKGELDDVPCYVKQFRLDAAADKLRMHPGCSFTLFWDDPARNPLGTQLETIGQRV
jgi:hypothetical protein